MVQVQVSEGILQGEIVNSEIGGTFYSFKGIPFAEPPLGGLRFKAPQPPQPWEGIRSAKDFGAICKQYDMFSNKLMDGDEDCLYLNVYKPLITVTELLPVMVWIHGGGFLSGSGNDNYYGPEFLIRHGVILVTFNYRLEVLGFLSLETEDIPGNAGMKDQVAALKWIKKNIQNFGGDPNNVTIFGESAGGASVAYHLVSPMSKGLFRRAIAQSGASTNWWSRTYNPRERARLLAKGMGFDSDDDKELYEFFKSQPIEKLIFKKTSLTWSEEYKEGINLFFCVVEEKQFGDNERFFYSDIADNWHKHIHEEVEIIAGYNKDEGLISLGSRYNIENLLYQANFVSEYFVPGSISWKCPMFDKMKIAKEIRKYYFNDKIIGNNNLEPLLKYLSMDAFIYDIIRWVKSIAATGRNKIYMYKFSYSSERNIMAKALGSHKVGNGKNQTCHGDDMAYLFPMKEFNLTVNKHHKSYEVMNTLTILWTNFARRGNPTPNSNLGNTWSPFTIEDEEFLEIGVKLSTGTVSDIEEVKFWDSLLKDYHRYMD